jgi:hypothetical protein
MILVWFGLQLRVTSLPQDADFRTTIRAAKPPMAARAAQASRNHLLKQ